MRTSEKIETFFSERSHTQRCETTLKSWMISVTRPLELDSSIQEIAEQAKHGCVAILAEKYGFDAEDAHRFLDQGDVVKKCAPKPKDDFGWKETAGLLDHYITYAEAMENCNKKLKVRKCRMPNFPSEISENIAKLAIQARHGHCPTWDTTRGDLEWKPEASKPVKKIEVKGFVSDGPASFGPTERWDLIYFVDGLDYKNKRFKVFEIPLSNTDPCWRAVMINKTESFGEIADADKRGKLRGAFYKVFKPQLEKNCTLIFDGHIADLKD